MSGMKQPLVLPAESMVEGKRWVVLLVFSWIEFNQALVWITFSASAPEATDTYGSKLTPSVINLMLNWGPIMYLVFVPIVMMMLNNNVGGKGVYYTILLGAVLCAAGSLVRLVPTWMGWQLHPATIWLLHAGQILNGCAGPSMAGACTAFAACWFAPDERVLATAIAYGICALGPALAFIFAMFVRSEHDLQLLLLLEMLSSVASCMCWFVTPAMPKVAPSASQGVTRDGASESTSEFWGSCWKACSNMSFVLLMTSGGIVFGVFQCWASSLTNTIKICPTGSEAGGSGSLSTEDAGCMSETLTQWLGFGGNIGTWVGTLVIAPIAERFFERRFKLCLLLLFVVQLILFGLYTASQPIGEYPALLPSSGTSLFVLFCAASAFLGATTPLFFELGAEVTYPLNEGVSAGLISGMLNLGGLIILAALAAIPPNVDSALITGTVLLCALMVIPVKEIYLRSDFDLAKSNAKIVQ